MKREVASSVTEVMDRQFSFPQPGQTRLSQSKKELTCNLFEKPQAAQPMVTSSIMASSSAWNISSELYYILNRKNSKERNEILPDNGEQLFGNFTPKVVDS